MGYISMPLSPIVWGRRHWMRKDNPRHRTDDCCELMTAAEARRAHRCTGIGIFELVPVEE